MWDNTCNNVFVKLIIGFYYNFKFCHHPSNFFHDPKAYSVENVLSMFDIEYQTWKELLLQTLVVIFKIWYYFKAYENLKLTIKFHDIFYRFYKLSSSLTHIYGPH